jgi:hypothetical protein
MAEIHKMMLQRLGNAFHAYADGVTREPLPDRWVELIHYLNEWERADNAAKSRSQPKPKTDGGVSGG